MTFPMSIFIKITTLYSDVITEFHTKDVESIDVNSFESQEKCGFRCAVTKLTITQSFAVDTSHSTFYPTGRQMQKISAKLHSMLFNPPIFSKLNPDQPYFAKTSYTKFHKNMTNSSVANTKSQMGRQGLQKRCFLHFLKSI